MGAIGYKEIDGDLIQLTFEGNFDVITHGCNCWCTMGAGIAPLMAKAFGCDKFPMEALSERGNFNKLGTIDSARIYIKNGKYIPYPATSIPKEEFENLSYIEVVNAYTQFNYGKNHVDGVSKPLDYDALRLCLRKINYEFSGLSIGLPAIGCGLAGGNWDIVKQMIQEELVDCDVTVVLFKP